MVMFRKLRESPSLNSCWMLSPLFRMSKAHGHQQQILMEEMETIMLLILMPLLTTKRTSARIRFPRQFKSICWCLCAYNNYNYIVLFNNLIGSSLYIRRDPEGYCWTAQCLGKGSKLLASCSKAGLEFFRALPVSAGSSPSPLIEPMEP